MKKNLLKWISVLVTIVLALSYVDISVFAEEPIQEMVKEIIAEDDISSIDKFEYNDVIIDLKDIEFCL